MNRFKYTEDMELLSLVLVLATVATRNIPKVFAGGVFGCERWRVYMHILAEISEHGEIDEGTDIAWARISNVAFVSNVDRDKVPWYLEWLVERDLVSIREDEDDETWVSLGEGSWKLVEHRYTGHLLTYKLLMACADGAPLMEEDLKYIVFDSVDLFADEESHEETRRVAWACFRCLWGWPSEVEHSRYVIEDGSHTLETLVLAAMMAFARPVQISDLSKVFSPWFGFSKMYIRKSVRALENEGVVERVRLGDLDFLGGIAYKPVLEH